MGMVDIKTQWVHTQNMAKGLGLNTDTFTLGRDHWVELIFKRIAEVGKQLNVNLLIG